MIFQNATLVEIAKPGPLAPNGDPGAPVAVWKGKARGYLKRVKRMALSGGENVLVRRDVFTLLRTEGAPVVEQAGADWEAYTVVIEDKRTNAPEQHRYVIRGMENRAAGTPVDSIRLELDPQSTT